MLRLSRFCVKGMAVVLRDLVAMSNTLSLFVFFALVGCAAITGALFPTGDWYEALNRPSWTPPNWVFPIAWTILYFMIAIAGWRVWKAAGFGPALIVWGLGVAFNAAWSWIMFGEHQIGWALADLIAMGISIVLFIALAWPIDRTAAYLFLPYLVWVTYAGALNLWIWQNN
jgi:translocator protein